MKLPSARGFITTLVMLILLLLALLATLAAHELALITLKTATL